MASHGRHISKLFDTKLQKLRQFINSYIILIIGMEAQCSTLQLILAELTQKRSNLSKILNLYKMIPVFI